MERFSFAFANKEAVVSVLPGLFRILHANMSLIAPTGSSYEEDFAVWRENILPAMKTAGRQIVLMTANGELAGYFQYNADGDTLMMEEIEICPKHQGSGLFRALYLWLETRLPAGLVTVEAYAHKDNRKSQAVLEHLGLRAVGENPSGSSWHYRGSCPAMWETLR